MKNSTLEKGFDERQILERGRAFRNAYLTLAGTLLLMFLMNDGFELYIFDGLALFDISIMLSLAVFGCTAVLHDAFDSYDRVSNGVPIIFGIYGVISVIMSIVHIVKGDPLIEESGVIGSEIIFLFTGLCFASVGIAYLIKRARDKKASEE